jgi:hypothetical protein
MWKPAMTRVEADAWAAGSSYVKPIFHATSRDAAASIRRDGFDLSHRRFGRVWGNGIYATPEPRVASIYAGLHGADAATLELRVNLSRVLSVRLVQAGGVDALRQVLTAIPGGYARFVDLTIELSRMEPGSYARPEALTRTIVQAGYDALEIVEVGFTTVAGGTQLVVYDPQRVVVVDD